MKAAIMKAIVMPLGLHYLGSKIPLHSTPVLEQRNNYLSSDALLASIHPGACCNRIVLFRSDIYSKKKVDFHT